MNAAARWRDALAEWAIPDAILSQAPESPWIHPPALFGLPERIEDTPSHARAREALPEGGSVLDVGCGGGIAAYAITPPARRVIGVDHQAAMLAMFREAGAARGVEVLTVEGDWPAVASITPVADVVTTHHVVYNVGDIVPFLEALTDHARRRVVVEMPERHPLAGMTPAWRHFWDLDRPDEPTPEDLLAVLAEMGVAAHSEYFTGSMRGEVDLDQAAHFTRIRLCLAPEREGEVREFLAAQAATPGRALRTIWWDVA